MAGIADPLRELGSMHVILDVVEQMAAEGKSAESNEALQRFWFALYQPEPDEAPADFDVDDQMDAFDAFTSMAAGMH